MAAGGASGISARRKGLLRTRAAWRVDWIAVALCRFGAAAAGAGAAADVGDGVALLQSGPAASLAAGDEGATGDDGTFQPLREEQGRSWHTWYHLHTPRTAGSSLYQDAKKLFRSASPGGVSLARRGASRMLSKEGCFNWKDRIAHINIEAVAMMVREPRAHVFSQFLFCHQGSESEMTGVKNLTEWLQEWVRLQAEGKVVGNFANDNGAHNDINLQKYVIFTGLPFKCYNPINLQTHHLTCDYPFEYPTKAASAEVAIRNMQEATFVGITEFYQESMCVFHSMALKFLPGYCDCRNQTAWKSFQGTHTAFHSVQSNSGLMLVNQPAEVLATMDALTRKDAQLYKAALKRFRQDALDVEEAFNTSIICDERPFMV
mmetsp:Transcript_100889/g.314519  ORF Transcript_100889/g.314519 Transcript_100889/m.314519 type:complete len:375 (+) Transcript_100889:161-1285(+)|eukprot:CAMPEP_0204602828 /NCGR_PEP_ID=MMETSP0661-20131031/56892_1 /ASSEMBLY_ACC=CAM_ASM_000606 /TAXON_ID=109239 /ORGANISM="Alexandrium margalefi, Strain AMGDE01CS-322" /LENGTH=374 /DNA_ID=CAMNT_0051613837 /DNA_START=68 /DNA_END=1195 /DNA_ORIENTATION=+